HLSQVDFPKCLGVANPCRHLTQRRSLGAVSNCQARVQPIEAPGTDDDIAQRRAIPLSRLGAPSALMDLIQPHLDQ
ncbi:hypothetical protein BHM03_00050813, partial [Ensete ventricosum]